MPNLFGHDVNRNDNTYDANIDQGPQPTCAVRSEEIVLRDFGIQIPQDELRDYAQTMGWYNEGTKTPYIGNLLEACGVHVHKMWGARIANLIDELSQGHRVIVSVDSDELWSKYGSDEWKGFQAIDGSDHALIVAGINVDKFDPHKLSVVLTDPGNGKVYVEYNINHFYQAWQDSRFFMMATDEAAPYQYNEVTHLMEPSNFATEFNMAKFPFHNEFSNFYGIVAANIANNYVPHFGSGHYPDINEDLTYEQFKEYLDSDNLEALSQVFSLSDDDSTSDQLPNSVIENEYDESFDDDISSDNHYDEEDDDEEDDEDYNDYVDEDEYGTNSYEASDHGSYFDEDSDDLNYDDDTNSDDDDF